MCSDVYFWLSLNCSYYLLLLFFFAVLSVSLVFCVFALVFLFLLVSWAAAQRIKIGKSKKIKRRLFSPWALPPRCDPPHAELMESGECPSPLGAPAPHPSGLGMATDRSEASERNAMVKQHPPSGGRYSPTATAPNLREFMGFGGGDV